MVGLIVQKENEYEICSLLNKEDKTVLSLDNNLSINEIIDKFALQKVDVVIVDFVSFQQNESIVEKMMQLQLRIKIQIILLIQEDDVSDPLFPHVINVLRINDVVKKNSLFDLKLKQAINDPADYSAVLKYISPHNNTAAVGAGSAGAKSAAASPSQNKAPRVEQRIVEKEVTVIEERLIGNISINVGRLKNSLGCSTVVESLAKIFSKYDSDVAVSISDRDDFDCLQNFYTDSEVINDNHFKLDGIHFYHNLIVKSQHKYIVYDFGLIHEDNMMAFLSGSAAYLISGCQRKNIVQLEEFIEKNKCYFNCITYLINFASDAEFNRIATAFKNKATIFKVPITLDAPLEKPNDEYEKMVEALIPRKTKRGRDAS